MDKPGLFILVTSIFVFLLIGGAPVFANEFDYIIDDDIEDYQNENVLNPKICTVGYTGNYQCSGDVKRGEYKYSDCSTNWFNIETCDNGCSDGECKSQSSCTAGYTGKYQCSGNVKQTQYKHSDCSVVWIDAETCTYGCSGGHCNSQSSCTAGYTGNYQCSGNVKQGQYRYSDCSIKWFDVETCTYGCSSGQCKSQSSCTVGYTVNYQCSGNVKQTQYKYADCSTKWFDSETCTYGCSGGQCLQQPYHGTLPYRSNGQPSGNVPGYSQTISLNTYEAATCKFSYASGQTYNSMTQFSTTGGTYHSKLIQSPSIGVNNFYVKCKNAAGGINYDDYLITFTVTSTQEPYVSATVTTPSSTNIGQKVYTTVSFSNSGSAKYVNFYPYLCNSDGTGCIEMTCPYYDDSEIYINAYGSASTTCFATANTYGSNMIKMNYDFSGGRRTAYSGTFFVGTSGSSSGYTITATASTPGFVRVLDRIYTSITLSNSGQAAYVNLYPKLCKINDYSDMESYCTDMVCTSNQVYASSYGSSSYSCYTSGSVVGKHRIKLNYNTPGYDLTVYSGTFNIYATGKSSTVCTTGYTGNYRCSGNMKQRQYRYSDCNTKWFGIY